jgi:flagellar hook-basal body complex protein FliE
MQCPVCGSDRKPELTKCPTCGVDFSKWLNKVINKLNDKTDKVMKSSDTTIKKKPAPKHYKEVIKMDK